MDINVGDVLKLKKQHPCGSREWEVLRVGADFRLKCLGCGHQIMIARKLLEKNVKEIVEKSRKVDRNMVSCSFVRHFIPCSYIKYGPETKRR